MDLELKGERLLLRPHRETDLDFNIELGTDPEVMRYVGELESKEKIVQDMPKYTIRCAGGRIGVWRDRAVNTGNTRNSDPSAVLESRRQAQWNQVFPRSAVRTLLT